MKIPSKPLGRGPKLGKGTQRAGVREGKPITGTGYLTAGQKMGEFTLIQRVRAPLNCSPAIRVRWMVECSCGKRMVIPQYYMVRPNPKTHCGHLFQKSTKMEHKRVYSIWGMMRRRCNNPTHISYKYYGAQGIRVCPEWDDPKDGFYKFLEHIGSPPSGEHTLDRINPFRNYEPGNVRWATKEVQEANKKKAWLAAGWDPKAEITEADDPEEEEDIEDLSDNILLSDDNDEPEEDHIQE
jgi:hypothetical protein